jgi:1-acyl-sn-glycerol-3-phosphate acyltransferase
MLLRFIVLLSLVFSSVISLIVGAFESYRWLWLLPLLALGFIVAMAACVYGYVDLLRRRVNLDEEQDSDDPHYRKVVELLIESLVPLARVSVKTKGLQKVPAEGRFMLVCNHVNDLDPAPILYALPGRQLAFVAKQEVRDMFLIGAFLHKLQGQFINRENDREALKTILKCIQILKEDKGSVAVFPEGGIHDDRKFHRFRPGVFKIAQKAGVPIVVCTLKNTRDMITNLLHYKRSDTEFSVLTVLQPEDYAQLSTTELAEQIYELMAADLGPENVAQE